MGVENVNLHLYTKGGVCSVWRPDWRLIFLNKNNGDVFSTSNPEKDLMDLLIDKTKTLGHMLTFDEASTIPDMVEPNSYAFYFGSFSNAAKLAWFKAKSL